METLAAIDLIRQHLPDLRVRMVNVVDLMRLQPESEHPHGMSDPEFDTLFTPDKPIIFAFHGYPWLIHRLSYRRTNHANLHVRGYKEEGTVTTPFDMALRNDIDRFHLVMDVIDRVPGLGSHAAALRQRMADERVRAEPSTPEPTAWIRRRSAAGPGRAERAGARPRPERRLQLAQGERGRSRAARAAGIGDGELGLRRDEGDRPTADGRRRPGPADCANRPGGTDRRGPPGRPRWVPLSPADADRRRAS